MASSTREAPGADASRPSARTLRSMTGFGRGRCDVGGRRYVVEIRTVNHRFLELKSRLPWTDPVVEQSLSVAVRRHIERGAVTIAVREEGGSSGGHAGVAVDVELARTYAEALRSLARECGVTDDVSVSMLAQLPGVIGGASVAGDGEALWEGLRTGVESALEELTASRVREGRALEQDLRGRLETLRRLASETAALADHAPVEARRRLQARLDRLLQPGEVDPQRLAQEVAILADRADVTEELTRLAAHLDEVTRLLDDGKPAGRRLDFLSQELHREVNTIGSKSQQPEIAARVVEAKAEVERFREQIQNIE